MTNYATWTTGMLTASIADRAEQLQSLRQTARLMVQQIEQAEIGVRSGAGHAAIYIGSLDAETFVHNAMADAETDLKQQLRDMRYELTEREMALAGVA